MKNLTLLKNEKENEVTLNIADFLEKEDYDSTWINQEESDTVFEIRSICDDFVKKGRFIDIQLWEEGNATVQNIDLSKLNKLLIALELKFGKFEIYEG